MSQHIHLNRVQLQRKAESSPLRLEALVPASPQPRLAEQGRNSSLLPSPGLTSEPWAPLGAIVAYSVISKEVLTSQLTPLFFYFIFQEHI